MSERIEEFDRWLAAKDARDRLHQTHPPTSQETAMTTMPQRFTKRPVTIEAIQWDGTAEGAIPIINWILDNDGTARYWSAEDTGTTARIDIDTLEGVMIAVLGDWIIRGVQGELYTCKDAIFRETYEPAAEHHDEPTDASPRQRWRAQRPRSLWRRGRGTACGCQRARHIPTHPKRGADR